MTSTLLVLGLAVLVGAVVQSVVGFGLAVVAAPFVVVLAPDLMPGALILTSLLLPLVHLAGGTLGDVAWHPLRWALVARLVLTPAGVFLVAVLPATAIALVVGVLILVVVALSVRRVEVRATPHSAALAGGISGVSGTAAAIGGPFFAMVLQHERPERIRSTLAVFFVAGGVMGLTGLAIGGELTAEQVRAGLVWAPFMLAGFAIAVPLRRRVGAARMRRAVLAFSTVAAVSVIIRALVLTQG